MSEPQYVTKAAHTDDLENVRLRMQEHREQMIRISEASKGAAQERSALRSMMQRSQTRIEDQFVWLRNLLVANLFALIGILTTFIFSLL